MAVGGTPPNVSGTQAQVRTLTRIFRHFRDAAAQHRARCLKYIDKKEEVVKLHLWTAC
jgi:hypothetical protein